MGGYSRRRLVPSTAHLPAIRRPLRACPCPLPTKSYITARPSPCRRRHRASKHLDTMLGARVPLLGIVPSCWLGNQSPSLGLAVSFLHIDSHTRRSRVAILYHGLGHASAHAVRAASGLLACTHKGDDVGERKVTACRPLRHNMTACTIYHAPSPLTAKSDLVLVALFLSCMWRLPSPLLCLSIGPDPVASQMTGQLEPVTLAQSAGRYSDT
jgi:hypothetical protein